MRIPKPSHALFALLLVSCGKSAPAQSDGGPPKTDSGLADVQIKEVGPPKNVVDYCDLPGSLLFGKGGSRSVVEGGKTTPSLDWLTLPDGYCAHYFGHVGTARQIRFAPGGELFVATPRTYTAGGAPCNDPDECLGAIAVLFDDDHDGYADGDAFPHADHSGQKLALFKDGLSSTQGIMFAPGFFYYQDTIATAGGAGGTAIMRLPYASGERYAKGTPERVANITLYESSVHWPKTLDIADDGTIYVGNGGDQTDPCDPAVFPRPFHGGVLSIAGKGDPPGGTPVARGFRNPIAIRCQRGHNLCFASELALDGSGGEGGREKIVPIRKGDDWGFPCCATRNTPYDGVSGGPNCSQVAAENVSLVIGDTPFGLDFEPGLWPAPYTNNVFVVLHGQVGSWIGASVVAIPTDASGMPVHTSDLSTSSLPRLAKGWDDGSETHGRPAAITFASDGRVFVANDFSGDILWMAPRGLKIK